MLPFPAMKLYYLMIFLLGARPTLLVGVTPEAMIGCLQPIIGSKLEFFSFEIEFKTFFLQNHDIIAKEDDNFSSSIATMPM
jgi:hypothetical protein